jgi:hypothetical protein
MFAVIGKQRKSISGSLWWEVISGKIFETELIIVVAEAWEQFGIPEEGECLLLEAVTRGMVKTELSEKIKCML